MKDLFRAVTTVKYYHNILKRPLKRAWAHFILLITVIAFFTAIFGAVKIVSLYNEALAFFAENVNSVEFINGEIVTMPVLPEKLQFKNWVIHVDKVYLDKESALKDLDPDRPPTIFIGPGMLVIAADYRPFAINYPDSYSDVHNVESLKRFKIYIIILSFLAGLLGMFIYKLITGLLYIFLIITPITLFKFRRMGLAYKGGLKAGFYLVSFQLIISTILLLTGVHIPWSFLLYILFYIVYIGAFVNIDVSSNLRRIKAG